MLAKKIGGEIVLLIVFSFSIIVLKVYKEFNFVVHDSSCIFLFNNYNFKLIRIIIVSS